MGWMKCLAMIISAILALIFIGADEISYGLFFLGVELLLFGGLQDSVDN